MLTTRAVCLVEMISAHAQSSQIRAGEKDDHLHRPQEAEHPRQQEAIGDAFKTGENRGNSRGSGRLIRRRFGRRAVRRNWVFLQLSPLTACPRFSAFAPNGDTLLETASRANGWKSGETRELQLSLMFARSDPTHPPATPPMQNAGAKPRPRRQRRSRKRLLGYRSEKEGWCIFTKPLFAELNSSWRSWRGCCVRSTEMSRALPLNYETPDRHRRSRLGRLLISALLIVSLSLIARIIDAATAATAASASGAPVMSPFELCCFLPTDRFLLQQPSLPTRKACSGAPASAEADPTKVRANH